MKKWECQKCGACCRSNAVLIFLPEYWDEEKKKCIHLTEENLCDIYEDRPDVCRMKEEDRIGVSDQMLFDICKQTRLMVYGR